MQAQLLSPVLTITGITTLITTIASVIFLYFPRLNTWFASKPKEYQQLFFFGLTVLVFGFFVLSSCMNWWTYIPCTEKGIKELLELLVGVIVAGGINQGFYSILPQPGKVLEARSLRTP